MTQLWVLGSEVRGEPEFQSLVTLVSHLRLLWRGVTQGVVASVFPFGVGPYLFRREDQCTSHAMPSHCRTRISVLHIYYS